MGSVTRSSVGNAERRAEVEARLLASTARLLAEGASFTELSVQRIAAASDVPRSTFYLHFPDKSALLSRLAETLRRRAFDLVSGWQQGQEPAGLEDLELLYWRILALFRENAALIMAINEVSAYDRVVREGWQLQLERYARGTSERLVRDQRRGLTPADLDLVASVTVIVWGGDHAIMRHIQVDDGSGDEAFGRELARIVWYGAFRRPAG